MQTEASLWPDRSGQLGASIHSSNRVAWQLCDGAQSLERRIDTTVAFVGAII